jgi:hypothetical protein
MMLPMVWYAMMNPVLEPMALRPVSGVLIAGSP